MLIDWFTVGAQTLNFLILVWLMKRFLYQPVLDAIDAREQRIAQELADAAQKQAQAQQEREEFQKKNTDFDQQRDTQRSQLKDEISTERQRLLDEARQAANALQIKRQEALISELQTLQHDIARRSREEVLGIANQVLTDLADTTLEARMVEVFTQRLRELDVAAKTELTQALNTAANPVQVRSAFVLSPQQQAAIRSALADTLSSEIQMQFDTAPGLISGIELSANGWKLAWNMADSLASLEQRIAELVQAQTEQQKHTAEPEKAS